jgi:hypothetical protein
MEDKYDGGIIEDVYCLRNELPRQRVAEQVMDRSNGVTGRKPERSIEVEQ